MEAPATASKTAPNIAGQVRRGLVLSIISVLTLSALIGVFVVATGNFGEIEARVLGTTVTVGALSILGLAMVRLLDIAHARWLAVAGLTSAVAAFVVTLTMIWVGGVVDVEYLWRSLMITWIAAFTAAHISLLITTSPVLNSIRILTTITYLLIACVAIMLIILVFSGSWDPDAGFYRILGSLAILDVLGTILIPILRRVMPPKSAASQI